VNSIENDIRFLSQELEDRQSQTDQEQQAAQYITDRLKALLPTARRVDFDAVGNFRLMFAAYCGEFILVGLVALWWPTVAFFYGLTIFLAYMAEFIGYPVFSRFLPHYESSSAVGLLEAHDASCFLVFTAYLDTDDNPFARVEAMLARFQLHYVVIACMVLVLATCGIDALGAYYGQASADTWWMRLLGVGALASFSVAGFVRALATWQNRGANNNASGLAALLHVAERLNANPIPNTSALFYAAGSHHANMAGMRTMLTENPAMTENTYLVNIEGVGAGQLCYTRAEGILHQMPCAPELVAVAEQLGKAHQASPTTIHNRRTNAYLPLMRGVHAMSVTRLGEDGLPVHFGSDADVFNHVDSEAVLKAAVFAELVAREAAKRHLAIDGFNDND